MIRMEGRDSEGVPFAGLESLWSGIWQIQALPEGCRKVVTWPSQILKICTKTHVEKIHRFQKCYSFQSTTKDNEVIAEKPFQNSGVTRRLWTLGCELTLVVNTSILLLIIISIIYWTYSNLQLLLLPLPLTPPPPPPPPPLILFFCV